MKRWIWSVLVLVLVLALSACREALPPVSQSGVDGLVSQPGVDDPVSQGAGESPVASGNDAAVSAVILTEAGIKQTVLAHAGVAESAVSRYSVEYDADEAIPHYEVEFIADGAEYDYEVHAVSGQILKAERNDVSLLSSSVKSLISAEQAKAAALAHAGLAANAVSRLQVELDADDVPAHYEVEFVANGYEYDYDIHAETAAVLSSDKERAD